MRLRLEAYIVRRELLQKVIDTLRDNWFEGDHNRDEVIEVSDELEEWCRFLEENSQFLEED